MDRTRYIYIPETRPDVNTPHPSNRLSASPPGPLRPAEPLLNLRPRMQLLSHALFRNLAGLLDLELLLDRHPALGLGDREHGALHERVEHARLDGLCPAGGGVREDEEDGRALGAVVRVRVPEEGEAGLRGGYGLRNLGDGGGVRVGGDEFDGFGFGVDFLFTAPTLLVSFLYRREVNNEPPQPPREKEGGWGKTKRKIRGKSKLTNIANTLSPLPTSLIAASASSPTGIARLLLR